MNRGTGRSAGYTIVETMIFLAVSAAMFVSAMALISGRQAHADFDNSIREFQSSMEDIANDVSTGYYADATTLGHTISCTAGIGSLTLSDPDTTNRQGQELGCIFIGKSLIFGTQDKGNGYYSVVPLVGKQWVGAPFSDDVQNYSEAKLTAVAPTASGPQMSYPDASRATLLSGGVTVECVFYGLTRLTPTPDKPCTNTPGARNIDTVTFLTTFHALDNATGQVASGSSHVDLLVPRATASFGRPQKTAVGDIDAYAAASVTNQPYVNPAGGVYICLQSNGTNQHALVSLGGDNSRFSTNTDVEGGKCL